MQHVRAEVSDSDPIARAETTEEELKHEIIHRGPAKPLGIPVHWEDGAGKTHLRGPDARVVTPNDQDVALYSNVPLAVCGDCKYFDLEKGREEMARQRFAERLVREEKWKMKHLGSPADALGLCGASGGQMVTGFATKSCDQYRPKGRR